MPEILTEGDLVRVFVGDPEGYFLEFDTLLVMDRGETLEKSDRQGSRTNEGRPIQ
jgi:hypothetical protein